MKTPNAYWAQLVVDILGLRDAAAEEILTLTDILDREGFGGREDCDPEAARSVAEGRLVWLRCQRSRRDP